MTKSRKRHGKKRPKGPYRSIASQMTPAHFRAMHGGADAELEGDARTALRLHRSVPMFLRSTHGDRLDVLAQLGPEAPGWLVNRWMAVQAGRRMWTGGDEGAINRTLQFVVPMLYPDGIPFERIGCRYPEQVLPFISGRDWVVRQVDLYELGGLRKFVRQDASPALLERGDQVEAWVGATMGAWRYDGPGANETLRFTDLVTKQEDVELLDLGLGEGIEPGQHVLGRAVPTSVGPGRMLEGRALPVPERTARAVARAPGRWFATLEWLVACGRLEVGFSHQTDSSLTSDLPTHAWMTLLGTALADAPDEDPDRQVDAAVEAALALATEGPLAVQPHRHAVKELMLEVALTDQVRMRHVEPHLGPAWQVLADVVHEPAKRRCAEMVMWCDASPGSAATA